VHSPETPFEGERIARADLRGELGV
jgi:hypothetical protein